VASAAERTSITVPVTQSRFLIVRIALAFILMAVAANRFLSYLWWTACYSAWSGIPKMAEQWRAAGVRASFNEWTFILLEIASLALLCTAMRLRIGLRLLASFTITVVATALFALALSWFKQGIH
jgi:hypothetical protein